MGFYYNHHACQSGLVISTPSNLCARPENRLRIYYENRAFAMELTYSDAAWWYFHELSSRVVAESGNASDRYHIGKILLRSFKDAPDFIAQIDGATDERDTFKSTMERSIRCAYALKNFGVKQDDVIIVMAPNHLDVTIPMYAALYLGVPVSGVDMNIEINVLQEILKVTTPKIIFCENFNATVVQEAMILLNILPLIVTFGKKQNHMSFTEFLESFSRNTTVDHFRPAELDTKTTIAFLVTTSGSTGLPKAVVLTHENVYTGFPHVYLCSTKFPTPYETAIVLSPAQWISAILQFILTPVLKITRVQTSSHYTPEHVYFLINKYKPEFAIISPTFLTTLLKPGERDKCDFTSFKYIFTSGSTVTKNLLHEIKKVAPTTFTKIAYGLSETSGSVTNSQFSPDESLGVIYSTFQYKLVDPTTKEIIREPNVTGELILKGPNIAKGYYNNPEATAEAFDDNGWFKTGDLMYRDEYYNIYFVDRLKLLLTYNCNEMSPLEIERVIIQHPDVLDDAVTGIPDDECGDLPVAFVVKRENSNVTVKEIEDLVKASLTDPKRLRGGVVFLNELPIMAAGKVDRQKLKQMAVGLKKL